MAKIKDSAMLCLIAGLIGTGLMDLSNFIRYKRKTTELLYGHLAGSIIMAPFRLRRRRNFFLGQIYHLLSGVVFAFPLLFFLKKTGTDYHRIKGAGFGLLTWGVLYNAGKKFGLFTKPRLTRTHYSAIQNNLIYGIVTAEALVRLGDQRLLQKKVMIQQKSKSVIARSEDKYDNPVISEPNILN
ncbi:MAG: hypothetical protein APF84_06500 [Gracilibacter sp. BRH_c7a]|nr:MAG: hypothetical protein APF84_06500 [Gracilibacter sp. BRH_c7a]